MPFDGFISYSHAADGRLAPAVQRGLHRLAKPWHRRRALWIFRDQTGLAVTPGLWSSIQTALDGSEYFVLLASPEAARSPWVNREIEHWIATKSADKVLPVVTDGEWAWDEARGDFTEDSTAVPPALRTVFTEEPFFLDLRWARGSEHLSLHHTRFRDAIAQLAAPMHGISKDELEGEDVRQHRRARRMQFGAVVTLVVLALLTSLTGISAVRNGERAKAAAAEALRQQRVADGQRDNADRSAEEARRQQGLAQEQQRLAEQQQARAAQAAVAAQRSERLAQQQQKLADQASVEADRQQRLADRATRRTREQQRLAQAASERAQRLQQRAEHLQREAQRQQREAKRLAAIADEQRRLARAAATEAARQQAKADQQQRIAVSRRLMNQAGATVLDDPRTALMLGAAAQGLNPDVETRRQLAGVITATHYAGTLPDVSATRYGRDGVLAARENDGHVSLWNVSDPRKPVRTAVLPGTALARGPLEFSPDGRTLGLVGEQRRAELWNVADPARPARLTVVPTELEVTAVTFNGDGTRFVTGDAIGDAVVWDTTVRTRPTQRTVLTGFRRSGVQRLAMSADGRFLIVDAVRFVPTYDLSDPDDPVAIPTFAAWGGDPIAFSPDRSTLALGKQDGSVDLYDVTTRVPVRKARLQAPPEPPPIDPDPADRDPADQDPVPGTPPQDAGPMPPPMPTVEVTTPGAPPPDDGHPSPPPMPTDEPDTDPYDRLVGLPGPVSALAFSPDGSTLAAGDANGTVLLWNRAADSRSGPFATLRSGGDIDTLSFDPHAGMLVSADGSGSATLWRVPAAGAPDQLSSLSVPGGLVRATVFGPDGRSLIAAGPDGTLRTWDTTDPGRPVRRADGAVHSGKVRTVAFSPDHRTVATVGGDGTLAVADAAQPGRRTTLATLPGSIAGSNPVAFSPDGRTLAAVADATRLQLWNVADRTRPAPLATLSGTFGLALAFSRDGRTLATGGDDRLITLWNLANHSAPARLAVLSGHADALSSLTFSPDGRTLASGSFDRTAALWDVARADRPHRLAILSGHAGPVSSVVFSPDGRTLATAGTDYAVILWDNSGPAGAVRLATLHSAEGADTDAVAFRNDGRTLAVTAESRRDTSLITLWSYQEVNRLRDDPAAYACGVTGRGLTREEWARYIPELPHRRTCAG